MTKQEITELLRAIKDGNYNRLLKEFGGVYGWQGKNYTSQKEIENDQKSCEIKRSISDMIIELVIPYIKKL